MSDMDTEKLLELDALEDEGRRELLSFFENLDSETNISQENHTLAEERKSSESENNGTGGSDYLQFFENLGIDQTISLQNYSSSNGGISRSVKGEYYESTPCQTCAAKGKTLMKKLIFINYEEALYMCENVECENDSTDNRSEPIRINFWEKPLTVQEIENINLPGEILQHIPVITYGDAIKILNIAKYRAALQNFALAKEVFSASYRIQSKLFERSDADFADVGDPPCKSDFFLAEVSDYEVKSIFEILDAIDKAMFASETVDKIILKNKKKQQNKSKPQISSESLSSSSTDTKAKKPLKVETDPKCHKSEVSSEQLVLYNPVTGTVLKEDKVRLCKHRNAKMMINSWNNQLKTLGIHKY